MDCLFCKIINNEIPSYKIYEDEIVLAFLDINPNQNGHTLIIPKKHYQDLFDIEDDILLYIQNKAREICTLLIDKLNADGITLLQNNGIVQDIKHYHLHLIPKYKNKKKIENIEEIYNILKS